MAKADLNFDFSVTNTIGTVSGTFTGEIFGLQNNATSAATSVVILSIPSGMDNLVSPPIDATLWGTQIENSFTVVNGQVTSGGFEAWQTIGGYISGYQLFINGGAGPYNFLNLDGTDTHYVRGASGLAAANIVPATSGVPEPSTALVALVGALGMTALGVWRRRSRKAM